jgi:HK97 family phage major capsid protein
MRSEMLQRGRRRAFNGDVAKAAKAGRYVAALVFGNAEALKWCNDNGITITKAQSESVNTAGGALVPPLLADEIVELRALAGVMRNEARVWPMEASEISIPLRTGGLTASFTAENAQISESQGSWGSIGLSAKKAAVLTRLSNELAEDALAALGIYTVEECSFALADKEDAAGFAGDGTSPYGGIIGILNVLADGNHAAGKVTAASGHDTFSEIDATDIAALMAALPERYWQTAKFHCSSYAAASTFARLGATAGGWIMSVSGPRPMLSYLGFPIILSPKYPGSGSQTGKVMITFGDLFAAVEFGDRSGVVVSTSLHRYIENDQLAIKATERFDIVAANLGDADNAGPLVGLVGN